MNSQGAYYVLSFNLELKIRCSHCTINPSTVGNFSCDFSTAVAPQTSLLLPAAPWAIPQLPFPLFCVILPSRRFPEGRPIYIQEFRPKSFCNVATPFLFHHVFLHSLWHCCSLCCSLWSFGCFLMFCRCCCRLFYLIPPTSKAVWKPFSKAC